MSKGGTVMLKICLLQKFIFLVVLKYVRDWTQIALLVEKITYGNAERLGKRVPGWLHTWNFCINQVHHKLRCCTDILKGKIS